MKAVVMRDWDMAALTVEEVAVPEPGAGEIRIKVHTAPVSFGDTLLATGRYQVKPVLPFTPGSECSGMVDKVGPGVSEFREGDRVASMGFIGDSRRNRRIMGSYADMTVAPITNVIHAPKGVKLEQCALFRANYETAYFALKEARLVPGETVLVIGAGGGTGFGAVTIAKAMGATVIASAGTAERRALAASAGADHLVDIRANDWRAQVDAVTAGRGVDVVYDPAGGEATERGVRLLAWRGRFLVIGFAAGAIPKIALNLPLMKGGTLIGANFLRLIEMAPDEARRGSAQVAGMIERGEIALPPVVGRFRLDQAAEAIAAVQRFEGAGRIVLKLSEAD